MRHMPFNRILVVLLTFAILPLALGQSSGTGASVVPDHITLTWTSDPAKSITVTWRVDTAVTSGMVQYQKGDKLTSPKQATAEPRDFSSNIGPARIFSSTLAGLSPDTKYSYRVGDGEHWSAVKSFTTAEKKAKSFKFIVGSDSQSSMSEPDPYGVWRDVLHKAHERNPQARFVVTVGDLVDIGQRAEHWNAWFKAGEGVIDTIPEMPTTGNHESFGSAESAKPAYWVSQFTLPQNGPDGLKGQVYSWDYGQVHFVVLQSQQREMKQHGDIFQAQKEWLDADLATSKALWKVVFFHKPPYGVMPARTNDDVKEAFCPIFDKHHVDIVINAHDHGLSRTFPIKAGTVMQDPSQGTVYFVDGRIGPKTYKNLSKQPWDAFFYDPQDQPTYMIVSVAGKKITVDSTKQDGTVVDSYTIEKH